MTHRAARLLTGSALAALVSGCAALALLGVQLPADPARGVTFSLSPFTDEGWSVLGARNQALLGTWVTDDWQLVWAQLPFSVVVATVFELFGVGIIQARTVSVACSAGTVALAAWLVAKRLGPVAGIVAGLALATSSLLLYYGRLALLEPMVMFLLVAGVVVLLSPGRDRATWRGLAAGAAFALAMGTKPSAGAAVAGIVAGVFVLGRRGVPQLGRRSLSAAAVLFIAGGAWAIVMVPQPEVLDAIFRIWPPNTMADSPGDAVTRVITYLRRSDRAIAMAAPLIGGGLLGTVLVALRWRTLDQSLRALAGAAIGWIAVGMGVLLLASYRPSRYVVPILPAMAILTGYGVALAGGAIGEWWSAARQRVAVVFAAVAVVAILGYRGIADLADWTAAATYRLPEIQAQVFETVTDGRAIQGAGPTFAMRVPVPTLIVQPDVNAGDLYLSHGVRWLLTNREMTPTWASAHPEVWAARELLVCYSWPSGEACLIRVP